jgi:superfamily I DNA/RNA helicase
MLAEERRCAYVEITRARKYLTLTTTGERFQKPAERSRFLSELPQGSFTQFDMQPE